MEAPVHLPISDCPIDHARMDEVCALVGGHRPVMVPRLPAYPAAECYANTHDQSARAGGRQRMGWMSELLPGIYIQAMHHAVWEAPDGRLFDVTAPQHPSGAAPATTFIPDDRLTSDPAWPILMVTNRYLQLVSDEHVRRALAAYEENNRLAREQIEQLRAMGWRWSRAGFSGPPAPDVLAKYGPELALTFQAMHQARAIIRQRYFEAPAHPNPG
jgi:hypothetical protein